uniref:SH3 domain-binding protein 5 homolog n=1 Tax=Strigamia maritima TaxID=126957 RepID=T1JAY8_STRMM
MSEPIDEDETLDPRIQIELEKLNTCADEINKLEKQFEDANSLFHTTFTLYSHKLKRLNKQISKSCIEKARPYYVAKELAKLAQIETQKAAVKFQRSVTAHESAKEAYTTAEKRFLNKQREFEFNPALQEMLNRIIIEVSETERKKASCEKEHERKAAEFVLPYFALKGTYLKELEVLKQRIEQLQITINEAKRNYAESLRNLEIISEEIHSCRLVRHPREPGVGAEKETLSQEMMDHVDGLVKNFKLQ